MRLWARRPGSVTLSVIDKVTNANIAMVSPANTSTALDGLP